MIVNDISKIKLIDKNGNIKGYITQKELSKALTKEHMANAVKSK